MTVEPRDAQQAGRAAAATGPHARRVGARYAEGVATAYRREAPRLLAFIRSRVTNGEDAEDILHEVFAQAARPNVLAAVDDVVAWLFRAARNRVADWYRRRGRRTEASLDAVVGDDETSLGDLLADGGVDVERPVAWR